MDAYNFSVICKIHTLNIEEVVIDFNIYYWTERIESLRVI